MLVSETLQKAKDYLSPDIWRRGQDVAGSSDGGWGPYACAAKGIWDVDGDNFTSPAYFALARSLGFPNSPCNIFTWNDAEGRTHADVMAAFDRAIADAQSIEQEHREGDTVAPTPTPAPVLDNARPVLA